MITCFGHNLPFYKIRVKYIQLTLEMLIFHIKYVIPMCYCFFLINKFMHISFLIINYLISGLIFRKFTQIMTAPMLYPFKGNFFYVIFEVICVEF